MFETLPDLPADPIIGVMGAYAADPRPEKMDFCVGVYKDASGITPVPRAVKAAERRLWEEQRTKTYTSMTGDPAYCAAVAELAFGAGQDRRMALSQAVGGSAAIYLLCRLAQMAKPDVVVHVSDPSWPNHRGVLAGLGMTHRTYPYFDAATQAADFDAMLGALDRLGPDDVVILHACCHNPTGADLNLTQWRALAASAAKRGWTPLIDAAYLGFGDGLDEDAAGMRLMLAAVEEAMVAVSCSKNLGLYRERAGMAAVLCRDDSARTRARSALAAAARGVYSFPPDHGAAVVREILADPALRADWEAELAEMRGRLLGARGKLAAALRRLSGSDAFGFVGQQRGMFSLLGLDDAQVARLRDEFAIYVAPGGRINIAALNDDQVERFAEAILAVTGEG